MLLIVPSVISLPRILLAETPVASAKERTVQGKSTTIRPFRGAAVFAPVRRMRSRCEAELPDDSSSSPPRRLAVVDRLRFNCRCSRPPKVARPAPSPSSSPTAALTTPRRERSFPLPGSAGTAARRIDLWSARRAGPFLAARSSRFFFSSCFRRCSESGLLPALLARMASGGSLISGFCGVGSLGFCRALVLDGVGMGAKWMVGPAFSDDFWPGFFSPGFFSPAFFSSARLPSSLSSGLDMDGPDVRCGLTGPIVPRDVTGPTDGAFGGGGRARSTDGLSSEELPGPVAAAGGAPKTGAAGKSAGGEGAIPTGPAATETCSAAAGVVAAGAVPPGATAGRAGNTGAKGGRATSAAGARATGAAETGAGGTAAAGTKSPGAGGTSTAGPASSDFLRCSAGLSALAGRTGTLLPTVPAGAM